VQNVRGQADGLRGSKPGLDVGDVVGVLGVGQRPCVNGAQRGLLPPSSPVTSLEPDARRGEEAEDAGSHRFTAGWVAPQRLGKA
jgi:hypothetical protein